MINFMQRLLFGHRRAVLIIFAIVTVALGTFTVRLRPDAGFDKLLPTNNPYIEVYKRTQEKFGGGNVLLVALQAKHGDIFTPQFFDALKRLTDEVFYLPGVDRTHVSSLYTPNTTYAEVVEGGFSGGTVIPATFKPDAAGFATVKANAYKAGIVGQLVANNFDSAVVSAKLNDYDPHTGVHLDYGKFAEQLDAKLRAQFDTPDTSIHILGFAQAIGDIEHGAQAIVLFFGISLAVAAFLLYLVSRSAYLTVATLACSVIAVVWQLGIITILGYGIDPISVLIPFLILAIGVSHGVQIALSNVRLVGEGMSSREAAETSFHRLLEPGTVALVLAVLTFVTVTTIPVPVIRELALTAAIGIASLMVTNLSVLPVLASYARISARRAESAKRGADRFEGMWRALAVLIAPKYADRHRRADLRRHRRGRIAARPAGRRRHAYRCRGTASAKPLQPGRGILPEQLHRQHRHPAGHRQRSRQRLPELRHRQARRPARRALAGCARRTQHLLHAASDAQPRQRAVQRGQSKIQLPAARCARARPRQLDLRGLHRPRQR